MAERRRSHRDMTFSFSFGKSWPSRACCFPLSAPFLARLSLERVSRGAIMCYLRFFSVLFSLVVDFWCLICLLFDLHGGVPVGRAVRNSPWVSLCASDVHQSRESRNEQRMETHQFETRSYRRQGRERYTPTTLCLSAIRGKKRHILCIHLTYRTSVMHEQLIPFPKSTAGQSRILGPR